MNSVDQIVYADYILTMDDELSLIEDGGVVVKDGKIYHIGRSEDIKRRFTPKMTYGGRMKVLMPGLINTHTHAAMVFFRGMADDMPLNTWLQEHIWPVERKMLSSEFVSAAVELAALEMVKAGITTYNDMYFFKDAAAIATSKIGMRAVLGVGILDFPTKVASTVDEYIAGAERFIKEWKGDELITPAVAPHALYTCGTDTLKRAKKLSEKYSTPVHIHLSETQWEVGEIRKKHGMSPVSYLNSIGFLDEHVVAAHCVWLNDEEIEILSEKGVFVSHCVKSNLKLASGIAPVVKMLDSGVKVTFGTDGAASNNTLDIIDEMSVAAKLHKAVSNDATALNDRLALLMATRWGAMALGIEEKTGSIEVGKDADFILADLNKPHLTPIYDIYSHIVYAMRSSDIEYVTIRGDIIVEDGRLKTMDEDEIMNKARYWQ
ncbi:MAG: amidohydrolase, partial [Nitrospirae bacterium]